MNRELKTLAEVAAFLICLLGGFTFAFVKVVPLLADVSMELMRHLFAVGFGLGIGVCFFLIYLPLQDLVVLGWKRLAPTIDGLRSGKKVKKEEKNEP